MISSLEQAEEQLCSDTHHKESSDGSVFHTEVKQRETVGYICRRKGHIKRNWYFNPKSKNYKRNYKSTLEIRNNLQKLNLFKDQSRRFKKINDEAKTGNVALAFMSIGEPEISEKWFLDSCASKHVTDNLNFLSNYQPVESSSYIKSASEESSIEIQGYGSVNLTQRVF